MNPTGPISPKLLMIILLPNLQGGNWFCNPGSVLQDVDHPSPQTAHLILVQLFKCDQNVRFR